MRVSYYTADFCKRVFFGDLLLHLLCELLLQFLYQDGHVRYKPTFSVFVLHVPSWYKNCNNNWRNQCKSSSPKKTRLHGSAVSNNYFVSTCVDTLSVLPLSPSLQVPAPFATLPLLFSASTTKNLSTRHLDMRFTLKECDPLSLDRVWPR